MKKDYSVRTNKTFVCFAVLFFILLSPAAYAFNLNLISFNGKHLKGYTSVSWKTQEEVNQKEFILERSDDGTHYYVIEIIAARNSGTVDLYSVDDHRTINQIAYYRLRQVDVDGREVISHVIHVKVVQELAISYSYNKILLKADVKFTSGSYEYIIKNINGQVITNGRLTIQSGSKYEIPIRTTLASGTYIIEIRNSQKAYTYMFSGNTML